WLEQYQDMDGIIAGAEEIKGKIGERLRENIDQLRLSYELATIKRDVELEVDINALVAGEEDGQELHRLFSELEFKSWIKELESQGIEAAEGQKEGQKEGQETGSASVGSLDVEALKVPDKLEYQTVLSEQALDELIDRLQASERIAITVEHDSGHFLDSELIGLAFSIETGKASYIPLAHEIAEDDQLLDRRKVLERLKPLLEDRRKIKVGFDLKTNCHLLQNYGIDLAPFKSDILLASYVLNSVAIKHNLPDMVRYYLDLQPVNLEEWLGKGRGKLTFAQLDLEKATQFAAEKADMILRLSTLLEHELKSTGHLAGLYRYYELPLISVLQKMERIGIKVEAEVLKKQSEELAVKLQELEQKVYNLAGEEFNLGSPKQLQQVFYEKLELPVLKKTKTGQPSTAEPVLQELAVEYELPRLILDHRSLAKLKSTYTDKLPLEINAQSGRIHSTYQQAVAATGRLSSTEPNLQNIPIRTAEGRRVRKAFVSKSGYRLVAADYSQVELRIMAHLSQDQGLLQAFAESLDVHRATAAEVFGVELDAVTSDQRRSAKAINFGLIYGMSAFGLANQLGIGRREAQEYVDRYFDRYPGVRVYMDQTQALADEKGYVETLYGRRLYLPDIRAGNAMLRRAAQRTAINAPMQGTAADIIKQAMIDIDHWLDSDPIDARMLLQVHDELIFEVAEQDVDLLSEGVRFRMVTAASLDVPLVVDVGVGNDWDEAH
ncbi:MAG: DNA polymerase I, partial [Gammaproteobacteria bacterium]|nr:DNA polymerase I [Gammaproteobacteria bacterium]